MNTNENKRALGHLLYDDNSVFLLDYLLVDGSFAFLQIFGKSQIIRQATRKIQSESTKGNEFIEKIDINLHGQGLFNHINVLSGGYIAKDINVNIFGMHCAFLIAKTDPQKFILFENTQSHFAVFNYWLNTLTLPIPKEIEFRKVLLEVLTSYEKISFSQSIYKQINLFKASALLFENDMALLRNCVQIIHKNLKSIA